MDRLNLRDLVSISMDGPSVNWKLFVLFQKDHAEQYEQFRMLLLFVGECECDLLIIIIMHFICSALYIEQTISLCYRAKIDAWVQHMQYKTISM